jgi:hypothetical protein
MSEDDPLESLGKELRAERERYKAEVLESRPFQDALSYLESITGHMLLAQTYVRLQGSHAMKPFLV